MPRLSYFLQQKKHLYAVQINWPNQKTKNSVLINEISSMIRGYYSNKFRGMRKKAGTDDTIPTVIPNEMSSKEFRYNWARLIWCLFNFWGIIKKVMEPT